MNNYTKEMLIKKNKEDLDKYEDCIPVTVMVPKELHSKLKIQCITEECTMKEVLHNMIVKGIQEKIRR